MEERDGSFFVKKAKLSAGDYAVFELEHTAKAIATAWGEIFMELGRQGYKMDASRPILERYANKMVKNRKCEICVPVG
ncbi:GyrI-like domain-containing protein [Acetobacterium bakii]|uniref:GyrI-like domain-containing protein n=1 Tax=Acetobacterium bakii TaxID=52689 RepID=UPI001FA6DE29|nr:GyrI-like domain-containing protein [Acetobacterium bakii]